jgi:putative transposase
VIGLRQRHSIDLLLEAAKLARSTFYYQQKVLAVEHKHQALKSEIERLYACHKGRYGYRRITAGIRQAGTLVNHKTIQRLMGELGLKSLVRIKKYRSYEGETGRIAPNLMARQFDADCVNQKWVTDVTEFNVAGKKLYLSPILDLYNGEIVAFETSTRPDMVMMKKMLKKSFKKLDDLDRPMLHSDQGSVYQSQAYQNMLIKREIVQSMSRKANCYDNATMESFFATLKSEYFYLNKFSSIAQLAAGLKKYIHYYNHERIRFKLNWQSPIDFRTQAG